MRRRLVGVPLVAVALAVLGASEAADASDVDPVAPEHVAGVRLGGDGHVVVVIVSCDDPDEPPTGEQLGVWTRRPGPRQVRWAMQADADGAQLPQAVRYGAAPPGFQVLQAPRALQRHAAHVLVIDGVAATAAGEPLVFRPGELVRESVWDGADFTDVEGLRSRCEVEARDGAVDEGTPEDSPLLGIALLVFFLAFGLFAMAILAALLMPIVLVVRSRHPRASGPPGPPLVPRAWPPVPAIDASSGLGSSPSASLPLPPPPPPPPPLPPPRPSPVPVVSRRRVALFVVLDVVVLLPVGSMLWHPVAKGGPTLAVWLLTLLGWQSLLLWLYQTVLRRPSQPSLGPGVVALGLVVVLPMAFTMARVLPDTGLAPPAFLMAAGALAGFWAWLCAR